MSGMFTIGETKVRPGAYSNIQKTGSGTVAGASDGVTAVLFRSDWGPVSKVMELASEDGYEAVYGNALTTDAIKEAINGGAKTLICCRVGSGGKAGKIIVKNASGTQALTITANYVGNKALTLTIRESLSDASLKECIIYAGTKVFEKAVFEKGGDEVSALADAMKSSGNFTAAAVDSVTGILESLSQSPFTGGENPAAAIEDYSDALNCIEAYKFNTVCVDTEASAVHLLTAAFLDRMKETGQFGQAVFAEELSVALETRMANAAAYNNEKVVYVVNPSLITSAGELKGYQTAARIAGMIAAVSSNKSLTHTVIKGAVELGEVLTPTQITKAELSGGLVLSTNKSNQIWIDSAINTLITLSDEQDEGWKKIRRTKTRYELVERAVTQADQLVGKVDNDTNGRASIVSQVQAVVDAMVEEGKLSAGSVSESTKNVAAGDSCWFEIDAIDKDSAEHIYLTFAFRYATA